MELPVSTHCPSFHTLAPRYSGRFFYVLLLSGSSVLIDGDQFLKLNWAMDYTDSFLRRILDDTKTIAMVGVSMKEIRPSYYVFRYLQLKGYDVIPVNPVHAGKELLGQTVVASLQDLADAGRSVDMVDIFRRPQEALGVVEEAVAAFGDRLSSVWMQIGVVSEEAEALAQANGYTVVMNRCPKIEYQRLNSELRLGGFNTGLISSKL